jgi:tetratricopeptide (TPR) repeat protein
LSMEAACDIFYDIYSDCGRSSVIDNLLNRLDFHALSITLLATTASHNAWDYDRLAEEWETQRAQVLQTDHNDSLAATIELSLTSPTFLSLGVDARDLLGVVAFFPQGTNEKHLDWLFPTIANTRNTFDKFCALSLTYRSNGFVTMLAPIRDYLGPQDPRSSPLLLATMDNYFKRLSVDIYPDRPGFEETRWIVTEDINVEHLLDVITSVDPNRGNIWGACYRFMNHLYWHKPRQTMLGSKIEALPDVHPSKPECLVQLSQLFTQVGNYSEQKRLLTHALGLWRRQGDDSSVADTLGQLARVNRHLDLYEEGIRQAKEALEIYKRVDDTRGQIESLEDLAWLLFGDKQLDTAENAASRAIDLAREGGYEFYVCGLHRFLGNIFQSKGDKTKAIYHLETAIRSASPFDWHDILFWSHHDLAILFRDEGKFGEASSHTEQAKLHADNDAYMLGHAIEMQASIWNVQHRLEEAKSEVLNALEIYEKLGAGKDAGSCRDLLQTIEREMNDRSTGFKGELPDTILHPTTVNPTFQHEVCPTAPWCTLPQVLTADLEDSPLLNAISFILFPRIFSLLQARPS